MGHVETQKAALFGRHPQLTADQIAAVETHMDGLKGKIPWAQLIAMLEALLASLLNPPAPTPAP